LRPGQPGEPQLRLRLAAGLFEERTTGPEMRPRAFRRALRLVDDLVVALQPMQDPELADDDVMVVRSEQPARGGQAIESCLGVGVASQRLVVTAAGQRRVAAGDRSGPSRVRERGAPGGKRQRRDGCSGRMDSFDHLCWPDSTVIILLNWCWAAPCRSDRRSARFLGSHGPGRLFTASSFLTGRRKPYTLRRANG